MWFLLTNGVFVFKTSIAELISSSKRAIIGECPRKGKKYGIKN